MKKLIQLFIKKMNGITSGYLLVGIVIFTGLNAQAQWQDVGSPGFSAGPIVSTSLAFDGTGTPYVAYQDEGNSYFATVMKFNGSSWVNVGSPGFSAGMVVYTSLAFNGGGTPYVAYRDEGNSSKATVMKFNGAL